MSTRDAAAPVLAPISHHAPAADADTRDDPVPGPDWPRPLLVLMYHGIHAGREDHGHFDHRYSVTPKAFAAQMTVLGQRREGTWLPGASAASMAGGNGTTGVAGGQGAPPAVMISFDDGDASNAERALPCLQEFGLRAMFFVCSHHLRRPGWLSIAQLRAIGDAGMGVGSHGASHRFLNLLDESELRSELAGSREVLQEVSGRCVDSLALPGGRGGLREVSLARELGYRHVFGSTPGINAVTVGLAPIQRVAITRDIDLDAFRQILAWRGIAVARLRWRHRLLALPKTLLGDGRYDRLRQALLR